ncbi:MAG: 23S rRNA pseudouridine(1911/1915/1917) synthase RluD, partial [Acidiferrobacterales bacterium]|nr:23S rRNA pseudouridine(1911/1915/1917) synthase RluD [Acidiferrobacterales bacterium]
MMTAKKLIVNIPAAYAGKRLDQVLAAVYPELSRSRLQQWIQEGYVRLDATQTRRSHKVKGGETVELYIPEVPEQPWQAQAIALDVVYEDKQLLVVNKPAGMVTHPAPGNREGTLLNALLHHDATLNSVARAGIVHRLDKDTSGLLVIAKTEAVRLRLVTELRDRRLTREYLAVVNGVMIAGGEIEAPIGRHPRQRTRMAVAVRGKPAMSHYRVKQRFRAHTLVVVQLESGRTHQIRVHLAHIGFPIIGDRVYGGRVRIPPHCSEHLSQVLRGFRRQALHAARLGLIHPVSGARMQWTAPLPEDVQALIEALKQDTLSPAPSHKRR